jgi:parvulin-like peptidyl-prolyl isomerase
VLQQVLVSYADATSALPHVKRTKQEAKARAEEARTKALAGAQFGGLATEYSDEPQSRAVHGFLNSYDPKEWPKAFAAAAAALPVGGVSEVIETDRGFHLIKRSADNP